MSLVSKWNIAYNRSTKYYAQIKFWTTNFVALSLWVMYVFYENYTHRQKKILRKKKQNKTNKQFFSCLWHVSIYTLTLWLKETDLHYETSDYRTRKSAGCIYQVNMESKQQSILFSMLDMEHKVMLRTLWLPVEWLI